MCCINSGNNLRMFCAAASSRSAGCNTSQLDADHFAGTGIMYVMELMCCSWLQSANYGSLMLHSMNHSPQSPVATADPQLMGHQ